MAGVMANERLYCLYVEKRVLKSTCRVLCDLPVLFSVVRYRGSFSRYG